MSELQIKIKEDGKHNKPNLVNLRLLFLIFKVLWFISLERTEEEGRQE